PFRHANRFLDLIAELPVEVELRAENDIASPVRIFEEQRHLLTSKVHLRHQPHELHVTDKREFAASFKVGLTGGNPESLRIDQRSWRERYKPALGIFLR